MEEVTRRGAMHMLGAAGAAAARGAGVGTPESADRRFVKECGFTDAEADCWEWTAKAAGAFFGLPKLHPMDDHEVAHAIHIIQHKLLSRPTYRKYLELAKAAAGKK